MFVELFNNTRKYIEETNNTCVEIFWAVISFLVDFFGYNILEFFNFFIKRS